MKERYVRDRKLKGFGQFVNERDTRVIRYESKLREKLLKQIEREKARRKWKELEEKGQALNKKNTARFCLAVLYTASPCVGSAVPR